MITKFISLFALLLILSVAAFSQGKKAKKVAGNTTEDYEIACVGVGVEGTKLISVFGYGSTVEEAERQAKRNAIHGLIFRGAPGTDGGCKGIPPLARSILLEQERSDYFDPFFEPDGGYSQFVTLTSQGGDGRTVIKIDKKTYKVGVTALVSHTLLRNELEKAGVIKKLDAGF